MRKIEIGNIAVHNCAICVIFKIDTNGDKRTCHGIDSNNNIHTGPPEEWTNILGHKQELHLFEGSIVDNIIAGRGL